MAGVDATTTIHLPNDIPSLGGYLAFPWMEHCTVTAATRIGEDMMLIECLYIVNLADCTKA